METTIVFAGLLSVLALVSFISRVLQSFRFRRATENRKALSVGGQSIDDLKARFMHSGVSYSPNFWDYVPRIDFTTPRERYIVTLIPVNALGFTEKPSTVELYARLKAWGLSFCPPELAIEFVLQYPKYVAEARTLWFYMDIGTFFRSVYLFYIRKLHGKVEILPFRRVNEDLWDLSTTIVAVLGTQHREITK